MTGRRFSLDREVRLRGQSETLIGCIKSFLWRGSLGVVAGTRGSSGLFMSEFSKGHELREPLQVLDVDALGLGGENRPTALGDAEEPATSRRDQAGFFEVGPGPTCAVPNDRLLAAPEQLLTLLRRELELFGTESTTSPMLCSFSSFRKRRSGSITV